MCLGVVHHGGNPMTTLLEIILWVVTGYLPPAGNNELSKEQFGETVLAKIRRNPRALSEAIWEHSVPFTMVYITAINKESVTAISLSSPSKKN